MRSQIRAQNSRWIWAQTSHPNYSDRYRKGLPLYLSSYGLTDTKIIIFPPLHPSPPQSVATTVGWICRRWYISKPGLRAAMTCSNSIARVTSRILHKPQTRTTWPDMMCLPGTSSLTNKALVGNRPRYSYMQCQTTFGYRTAMKLFLLPPRERLSRLGQTFYQIRF